MSRIVDLRKKFHKTEATPYPKKEILSVEPENHKEEVSPVITQSISQTNRIEWDAPSFYYNPQKKYLALVIVVLFCGAGVMLFYRMDFLTAIFLILSSLVLTLYANKKPAMSKIVINHAGVKIEDSVYYHKELKSFWLDYSPHGSKELSLEARKWYMPYIKVSIENQNPVKIRSLMINFVAEREHEKSLVDLISKKLGL